jgi:Fic family protein
VFREILALKERVEREILPRFSARRQDNAQILMRNLYARPVIDVKFATKLLNTTTNTTAALIADFSDYGILTEITGQRRNRLFAFREYINLFKR